MDIFKQWAEEHGAASSFWAGQGNWELAAFHANRAWHFINVWLKG